MKKGVVVNMQNDLEARPIALLVQKANQFSSQIYMESGDNKRVNVKSIMGMMSMALLNGDRKSTRLNSSHNNQSRMPSSA